MRSFLRFPRQSRRWEHEIGVATIVSIKASKEASDFDLAFFQTVC